MIASKGKEVGQRLGSQGSFSSSFIKGLRRGVEKEWNDLPLFEGENSIGGLSITTSNSLNLAIITLLSNGISPNII